MLNLLYFIRSYHNFNLFFKSNSYFFVSSSSGLISFMISRLFCKKVVYFSQSCLTSSLILSNYQWSSSFILLLSCIILYALTSFLSKFKNFLSLATIFFQSSIDILLVNFCLFNPNLAIIVSTVPADSMICFFISILCRTTMALFSKLVVMRLLVNVTTMRDTTKTPKMQTKKIIILPGTVLAYKSPYPTVEIVMMIFHIELK